MTNPLTLETVIPVELLVLIGSGEFSFGETREIDEFLLAQMPRDRRTVAFLPTASGSAEYAQHLGKYFHEIDPSVETVNVLARPGTPSSRTCPPASRPSMRRWSMSSWPTRTLPTSALRVANRP